MALEQSQQYENKEELVKNDPKVMTDFSVTKNKYQNAHKETEEAHKQDEKEADKEMDKILNSDEEDIEENKSIDGMIEKTKEVEKLINELWVKNKYTDWYELKKSDLKTRGKGELYELYQTKWEGEWKRIRKVGWFAEWLGLNIDTSEGDVKNFLESYALTEETSEAFINNFASLNMTDLFGNKDNSYSKFIANIDMLWDAEVINDDLFAGFKEKIRDYCREYGVIIPDNINDIKIKPVGRPSGSYNFSITVQGREDKIIVRELWKRDEHGENITCKERENINRILNIHKDLIYNLKSTTYENHLNWENTIKIKEWFKEVEKDIYTVGSPYSAISTYNRIAEEINKEKEVSPRIEQLKEEIAPVYEYLTKVVESNPEVFSTENQKLDDEYKTLNKIQ